MVLIVSVDTYVFVYFVQMRMICVQTVLETQQETMTEDCDHLNAAMLDVISSKENYKIRT